MAIISVSMERGVAKRLLSGRRRIVKIGSIHVHPLKGGRAVSLDACAVEAPGLAGDRRWMLVDDRGRAITQRDRPDLARLEASLDDDGLILAFDDAGERLVPTPDGAERATVELWRSTIDVALADPDANAALSDWLKAPVRLVHLDRSDARSADPDHAGPSAPVSLADGYPILLTTTASLRELNRTIVTSSRAEAVPMSRFRPNIVIDDDESSEGPFAEDGWQSVKIGDVVLDLVKPSDRCIVTTIDQLSGQSTGTQPLIPLSQTRMSTDRNWGGVLFGWNAVPRKGCLGRIAVGDVVEILDRREALLLNTPRAETPLAAGSRSERRH